MRKGSERRSERLIQRDDGEYVSEHTQCPSFADGRGCSAEQRVRGGVKEAAVGAAGGAVELAVSWLVLCWPHLQRLPALLTLIQQLLPKERLLHHKHTNGKFRFQF